MKKISSFLAVICALTTLLSTGCNQQNGNNSQSNSGEVIKGTSDTEFIGGLHEINYQTQDTLWIENGKTQYSICIPANAGDELALAASELTKMIFEATGAKLKTVTDDTVGSFNEQVKIISLGNTLQAEQAGIREDEALNFYGYQIKTVGNSIFIDGNTDIAVTNGVYGFLEEEVEFDNFTRDTYYVKNTKDVYFKKYNLRDVPDLKMYDMGTPASNGRLDVARRFRSIERQDFIAGGNMSVHTAFNHLPRELYDDPDKSETYHPDWYADDKSQLCYTAHGNEEELLLMKQTTLEVAKKLFISSPDKYMFIFSNEDVDRWCGCETCKQSLEQYGANSASVIKFCNDLAAMMHEWMESEEGKPYAREFEISYLAYNQSIDAPAYYDEKTGMYKPTDESVVCAPNTSVIYAPIEMDFQHSLYAPCNKKFLAAFKGWQVVSSWRLNFYTYSTNYNYYMYPYDCFNSYRELLRLAAESNTYWFFDLHQGLQLSGSTGWLELKNYIVSKLRWDVNRDINELINKYAEHVYGDGAEEVMTVFDEFRALQQMLLHSGKTCRTLSVYGLIQRAELWPLQSLRRWDGLFDKALEKIAYLKNVEPERYNRLYGEITTERVAYEFIMVELYEKQLNADYVLRLKTQIKEDCEREGIIATSSTTPKSMAEYYAEWGL